MMTETVSVVANQPPSREERRVTSTLVGNGQVTTAVDSTTLVVSRERNLVTRQAKCCEQLTALVLRRDFSLRTNPKSNFAFMMPRLTENSEGGLIVNSAKFAGDQSQIDLSDGGRRLRDTPNAGGSSVWSEVMSFEVLRELYNADLLRTETEIEYQFFLGGGSSKITDYSIKMFEQNIGVSVTRALRYGAIFEIEDGVHLLTKKLDGVNQSSNGVIEPHAWTKQVLHIWAESAYIADVLHDAYRMLSAELRADTLVMVTISQNAEWLYRAPRMAAP